MTNRRLLAFLTALSLTLLLPFAALAQNRFWVQIEAHATLRTAEEFAARYDRRVGNISGFRISGGWYALALGPFASEADAEAQRAQLLASREIREDAYVSDGTIYGARFWPAGAPDDLVQPPVAVETAEPEVVAEIAEETVQPQDTTQNAEPVAPPEPVIAEPVVEEIPEETVAEARRNERRLSRDERAAIQTALQWFGFYTQRIDAAFGPGTRRSIRDWQENAGVEPSGYLTTRQRTQLMSDYDAALARYSFAPFRDEAAGIEITLPMGMMAFDRHEAPFAHFQETNDSGIRALLLSQEGSQATLFGLYEIMQTLEIIPMEGERDRARNSFIITGQSDTSRAHVEARLRDGQIKGWVLLWDPSADDDAEFVLSTMRESFREIQGVLPSDMGATASTVARQDLIAGLEVRRPEHSRSGFFVDAVGSVVTTAEAVESCDRVTIDEAYTATIRSVNAETGVAVLSPNDPLVPLAFAQFADTDPRLGSEVRVAGFSYEDTLTRPIVSFGALSGGEGLNGEAHLRRLTLEAQPGDSGGPVFDARGAVVGMLLPRMETPGRMLPEDVNFAASAEAVQTALLDAGLQGTASRARTPMSPQILTRISADLTVLVSCWN